MNKTLLRQFALPKSVGILMLVCMLIAVGSQALPVQAAARIWCVAGTGAPTVAPCANPTAYKTIQEAVDAALAGDEIRIAAGVYTSSAESVVSIAKSLTLAGGYTGGNWVTPVSSAQTIVDGQNARPVIISCYAGQV